MKLCCTLVDEAGNSGAQLAFFQGETKTISIYPRTANGAPWNPPYNATDIEVAIQGKTGPIIKNFASGVGWLGAYIGFFVTLTSDDTTNLPVGRSGAPQAVNAAIKVTTPSGVEIIDCPGAFLVSAPGVAL